MKTKNADMTIDGVDYRFAGFWLRFTAAIIDSILLSLITAPLMAIAFAEQHNSIKVLEPANPLSLLINLGIPLLITIYLWSRLAATPGKMILNIKIINSKTFRKPTTARSAQRYLSYFLSLLPFGIGFIAVAFNQEKQGFHDMIAGTYVIRKIKPKEIGAPQKPLT